MQRLKMAILLVLINIFIVQTVVADPTLIIDDYYFTPEIFMPGDSGILTLTIKNSETTNTYQHTTTTGSSTTIRTDTVGAYINNVWIVHDSDSNGKKIKAISNYEDIGGISPGSSIIVDFEVIAENNISEGKYFPTARINVEDFDDVSFPLLIKISNETVDLLLSNVPSKISVSGSTFIILTAVNNRENSVEGVTIIPNDNNEIDFTPNSIYIGDLGARESRNVSFSIKPSEIGYVNLSFTVKFNNGDNLHTEDTSIPIEVIDTLDVAPVFINVPSVIAKGQSERVNLEVYNSKNEAISGVIVTPITDAIVSPSKYFIGSMDPDDVFSATFDISANSLEYGDYYLGFVVTFKQENDYYETPIINTVFSVVPQSVSNNDGSLVYFSGSIVIVAIAIFLMYIFFKKRRINK
jgi:hypothetical protein